MHAETGCVNTPLVIAGSADNLEYVTSGQFHQHAYMQFLHMQMLWRSITISPAKLFPTLRVHLDISYTQFLLCMLCALRQ